MCNLMYEEYLLYFFFISEEFYVFNALFLPCFFKNKLNIRSNLVTFCRSALLSPKWGVAPQNQFVRVVLLCSSGQTFISHLIQNPLLLLLFPALKLHVCEIVLACLSSHPSPQLEVKRSVWDAGFLSVTLEATSTVRTGSVWRYNNGNA